MSQFLIQDTCSVWQICGCCCAFQISVLFLTTGVLINSRMSDWREMSMVRFAQMYLASLFTNSIAVMLISSMLLIYPKRTHYTVDLEELTGIYRVTLIFISFYPRGHFAAPLPSTHYTIIFCFRNVAIWINSNGTIYCTSDGAPRMAKKQMRLHQKLGWTVEKKVRATYTVPKSGAF